MRSANSRRIWVSDTGNPHLSETAGSALYDPSYNRRPRLLRVSPDDNTFETIYQSLPPGLVLVACGGGYFRPLQSYCFSLKGAAIRKGADAMHFNWNCSREDWDRLGGIQHFRDFIELHHSHGVRLFLIDGTPQSGSLTQRTAELIRSPMALRSIDQDIAELIHQEAVAKSVTVIVTAIAEVVAAEHTKKALEDLDSVIREKQGILETMRGHCSEVERQLRLADAQAAIAALPADVAEQVREGHEALQGLLLKLQEGESQIASLIETRKRLKRKMSAAKSVAFLRSNLFSGSWKGILLEQDRVDDDWYSATAAAAEQVERYGLLGLVWECPQPPEPPPQPESVADPPKPAAGAPAKPHSSWLRRLFG